MADRDNPEQDTPASGSPFDGLTLLVVDDDDDLRLYVRQCVTRTAGRFRRVIEASDGESGLMLLRAEQPDVLVCDVLMPRLGGFALCERLRAHPETSDIPVLLLTGGAQSEETLRRADQAGADGVLLKPFNANRLCEAIDRVIEARASSEPRSESGPNRGDQPTGDEG